MHAHRFGMNFEETIVGKLAEVYQTVHLKEFTDFPKKDEKDPTTVAPAPAQVLREAAQPSEKFNNLIATQPTPKILAPLSCALTIGALWDTSKYRNMLPLARVVCRSVM